MEFSQEVIAAEKMLIEIQNTEIPKYYSKRTLYSEVHLSKLKIQELEAECEKLRQANQKMTRDLEKISRHFDRAGYYISSIEELFSESES